MDLLFQHTAAQRRLQAWCSLNKHQALFQHTAAQRRLLNGFIHHAHINCFNTQPRRGGCSGSGSVTCKQAGFNTQPRRGGCVSTSITVINLNVSTHSRAEAAACAARLSINQHTVSTHSRAEAAATMSAGIAILSKMFQHTAAQRRLPVKIALPAAY